MTAMGTVTMYSDVAGKSGMCVTCPNRDCCYKGEGITVTVRNFQHLFIPDYKNSWTLFCDLPDCRQLSVFLDGAKFSATLRGGIQTPFSGKIVESRITNIVELHVIET